MIALRYALARAWRGMSRSPSIQAITVATIAICLLLVGVVTLAGENLHRLAEAWGRASHVTVYLDDAATPERARQIADALSKIQGVDTVHVVEPREAFARLRRGLADRAELLSGVEETFLPTSIDVTFKPGVASLLRVHPMFQKLRAAPGIEDVEIHDSWAERLQQLEAVAQKTSLVVALLVIAACLFIIGATIRLGVGARKEAIQIERLVGATDGFVKAPFLIEGALQGLCGTAIALAILFTLYQAFEPRASQALSSMLAATPLRFFSVGQLVLALTAGTLLGTVASAAALARHREDA